MKVQYIRYIIIIRGRGTHPITNLTKRHWCFVVKVRQTLCSKTHGFPLCGMESLLPGDEERVAYHLACLDARA